MRITQALHRRTSLLVLQHLICQPFRLLLHLLHTPGLPILIIDSRKAGARLIRRPLPGPKLLIQIGILALHHPVYGIRPALCVQIALLARDNMSVYMGYALSGIHAVLDRDVKRGGGKDALDQTRHALDREEQVLHLGGAQVVEAWHDAARRDEHVAGEKGLEID